jgi:hypothetical protein
MSQAAENGAVIMPPVPGFYSRPQTLDDIVNATVGRALNLIVQNVGGAAPGLVDQSVMGHPGRYTYCIAEDPASPWPLLHTVAGLAPGASAVTCCAGDAPTAVIDYASVEPGDLAEAFAVGVANDSGGRVDVEGGTQRAAGRILARRARRRTCVRARPSPARGARAGFQRSAWRGCPPSSRPGAS